MKLHEQISTLRKERSLSQEDVAACLGVSRQAVSKWETGASSPDTENLIGLSSLLGVPLSELVGPASEAEEDPFSAQPPKRRGGLLRFAFGLAICLAVLFCVLWQVERNREEKLELLCHASAVQCLDALRDYDEYGADMYFVSAAGDFRAFMQAYHLLTEDSNRHGEYISLNEVYGCMLCAPGKIDDNISLLVEAMAYLSEDIYNYTGHNLMYDLYIDLRHG